MYSVDAGYLVSESPRVIVTNSNVKIPTFGSTSGNHSLTLSISFRFVLFRCFDDVTREKIQTEVNIWKKKEKKKKKSNNDHIIPFNYLFKRMNPITNKAYRQHKMYEQTVRCDRPTFTRMRALLPLLNACSPFIYFFLFFYSTLC